ncbi:hypothetical protein L249_8329, partial [Ophiocordyceps polyrhachis-furcata BCC 54312]
IKYPAWRQLVAHIEPTTAKPSPTIGGLRSTRGVAEGLGDGITKSPSEFPGYAGNTQCRQGFAQFKYISMHLLQSSSIDRHIDRCQMLPSSGLLGD